jgi:four helix bundle protein
MTQSYRDLVVWQRGILLVRKIYELTRAFPQHEVYGLTSQLRRAAVSIPSNLAEGPARYSNREFLRFVRNARGSLAEIETQILIAIELRYIPQSESIAVLELASEVGRMLNGLHDSISSRIPSPVRGSSHATDTDN